MSQHYEMTDATPLACSVIVIQSYTKVAGTLLHIINQIGSSIGFIDYEWQIMNLLTHVCMYLLHTYKTIRKVLVLIFANFYHCLCMYSYQITVIEVTLEILWEMRSVDDLVLSILYWGNGTFHNLWFSSKIRKVEFWQNDENYEGMKNLCEDVTKTFCNRLYIGK